MCFIPCKFLVTFILTNVSKQSEDGGKDKHNTGSAFKKQRKLFFQKTKLVIVACTIYFVTPASILFFGTKSACLIIVMDSQTNHSTVRCLSPVPYCVVNRSAVVLNWRNPPPISVSGATHFKLNCPEV